MKKRYLKSINFGFIVGRIWVVVTLFIVLISLLQGLDHAYVELDFRLFLSSILLFGWLFDFKSIFIPYLQYTNGYEINLINIIVASIVGFIDGFFSGYMIAKFYNFLAMFSGKRILNFALSCGFVFGLCSFLLSLVNITYTIGYESFDFSIRPLYLISYLISGFSNIEIFAMFLSSYINFPVTFGDSFMWFFWGFIDGIIGGIIFLKLLGKHYRL
ncbi:MAG: hypothetical protein GTO02_15770 [Candidatus Dadabacteria bacterium]|nr:hypothetical protein [Candidatus Dadabacteria bacterium]NIQ15793.1 hypothetical protein [Candidatus Dadabacteria bacterium]